MPAARRRSPTARRGRRSGSRSGGKGVEGELREQVRAFANGYSGEWRSSPRFTYKNCRTFQLELMQELELSEQ